MPPRRPHGEAVAAFRRLLLAAVVTAGLGLAASGVQGVTAIDTSLQLAADTRPATLTVDYDDCPLQQRHRDARRI